jgi:hypothetical protein
MKVSTNGDTLWNRQFGTSGWNGGHGVTVAPDRIGRVIVSACLNWPQCQAALQAYDTDGNALWQTRIAATGTQCGRLVVSDGNGNLYQTSIPNGAGLVLVKFSAGASPTIATPPASQHVTPGGSATFSVTAVGDAPLTYQWKLNGTAIAGATNATFTVANVQAGNMGFYSVTVGNSLGSVDSDVAILTVAAGT